MTEISHSKYHDIEERLIALTRDLILIPSIPSRVDDRRRCYEFIKNHLESIEHIEVREFEKDGIPSLVAAPEGCKKPDILMCGHLDVITHPDIALYRSEIKDGRIYGPGAGDMKGALAILIEIFRKIHSVKTDVSLGIAVTSDEEIGGECGIGFMFNKKKVRCKEGMIPDGGGLNEITVEEKGILHLSVKCEGTSSHAARPWLGDNPLERLMERLTKLKKHFDEKKKESDRWYPTCTVTIIETENQTTNRVPTDATAVLDVRFPPPYTVNSLLGEIKEVLESDIEVHIIITAEPTHLSPDPLYVDITQKITGQDVRLVKDDGGSDARFLAQHGIPVLMSRPLVGNLHAKNEWIDIKSMVLFYQIYEEFLMTKFGLK